MTVACALARWNWGGAWVGVSAQAARGTLLYEAVRGHLATLLADVFDCVKTQV
jgi:hypothetical protein